MLARTLASRLNTSLKFFPVTLIQGPRQVGKSFLLNALKKNGFLKTITTLDDLITLSQATNNPRQLPRPEGRGLL